MKGIAIATLFLAACAADEPTATNDLGIKYRTVTDGVVEGTFDTAYGSVTFSSVVLSDGVVDVTFDRGNGAFGSHVDWNTMTADLTFDAGFEVTKDDRFILQGLVSALEGDIGNAGPAVDNLIRQGNVWGQHPEGVVLTTHIEADVNRGWTTLCNVGTYTFGHDANSHGWQNESLACGRYETSNPCRDRCGPGCSGVGTSAWTRDCGNHDRCEQLHSSSECAGEFASASDDFSFAGNCSY